MLRSWLRSTIAIAMLVGVAAQARSASAVTSAELYTVVAYRYGRFRARVQFPEGDGVVGSFFLWKNGSEMPNVFWNELDFEKFGANCASQFNAIFGQPQVSHPSIVSGATDDCVRYHTYGYDWTPDHIAWSVDDIELRRDTGDTAVAYASQAAEGMQIRFNLWPGNPAFGGTFSASILPVRQFVSWVEYSSFTPGTGDAGGDFTLVWRESFENGIPADWAEGNWLSAVMLSTHSPANVTAVAGVAVLSLTADNATGFTGSPPMDPDDLPSFRGSSDGGPSVPDAGPADAGARDAGTADGVGIADSRIDSPPADASDSLTDVADTGDRSDAAALFDAAPDGADAAASSVVDATGDNSTDATSVSLADSSTADQPDGIVPHAEAASNPAGASDASTTIDASPSADAESIEPEAAAGSSSDGGFDSAVTINDGSTPAGVRRPSDQNGCGCRLTVASGPTGGDHLLAIAFLTCAVSTWSRGRWRRRNVASRCPRDASAVRARHP